MKKLSVLLVVVALWAMPALQPSSVVLGQSRAPVSRVQEPSGRFRRVEGAIPYRYIVIFRNDVARSGIPSLARELARAHGGDLRHVYMNVVKGFAVELPEAAAWALSKHPLVEYVEEEGAMTPFGTQSTPQGPSTFFGLDRIDQRDLPLNNTYNFNRVGSGVHAYILDTGIWPTHQEFGTRADVVRDTFGGNGIDDSITSHGTYVSGVLGGRTFGVAKNVLLHGVKVCYDNPFNGQTECPNGNILAGLDWVRFNHIKPAVVNMSFGGPANTTLDNAVRNTIASGVTCVVAAGNSNADASGTSPARVFEAITVAASINNDSRAFYSNFGWVVDLFAPGGQSPDQFIPVPRSGFHHGGANNVTDGFTGTSAASPHAAGVAALYLESFSLYTPNDPAASPASVSNALTSNATPDRVSNIPENCWMDYETGEIFCESSTQNLLLYSGFVAPPASNPIDDQRFFTRQQFYDTLRRTPDQGGWDGWTNYINQCGTDPTCLNQHRITTARGFLESAEFRNRVTILRDNPADTPAYNQEYVRQLYVCYLQREPDSNGYNAWLNYINSYPGDYDTLVNGFINSTEYRELRFK